MYRLQKISSEFFSWKKNYSGRQNLFAIRFCHPQLVKDTEKFTKSCVFDYNGVKKAYFWDVGSLMLDIKIYITVSPL